jgi:hypothetical protein
MTKRTSKVLSAAMVFAACSAAFGVENTAQLNAHAEELRQMFPGVRINKEQGRVYQIYGTPMSPGLDAQGAANLFIQMHGEAFGMGALSVQELWSHPITGGAKTVLTYQQFIGGIPVEFGMLKVVVQNGPVPQVVYAAGTLAAAPELGAFPAPVVSAKAAQQVVRGMKEWAGMPAWAEPELVIWHGNGDWVAPVQCWKFMGWNPDPAANLCKMFFVDAATGALVSVREETHHTDVVGTVRGWGSPGVLPDQPYNPPELLPMWDMKAAISGGNNAFSDAAGLFSIANPGATPVTVNSSVSGSGNGRWVNVFPAAGAIVSGSAANVTPPGPADVILNTAPSEQLTAQVNAFIGTTMTHNYFKSRAPGFNALDIQLTCNTGVSGTCNANFQPGNLSINFFNSGGGCSNTAFSTVISHEYGHFIVNRLGLSQNAFGEGYGDTVAAMIWDDYITGRGFRIDPGTYVRDPIAANIQYPCSTTQCSGLAIHCCGQILPGSWWRIRENLGTLLGSGPGLEAARQLQVDWSLITLGGASSSVAAGPNTAIEVLTVDDNDGNLANGTPHYSQICSAYAQHSIACPPLSLIQFAFPEGRPTTVPPNQVADFPVVVSGVAGTPQPGTGTLSYRVNGGSFSTISMPEGVANQYTANLPATACGSVIDYYVSAQATSGTTQSNPANAPTSFHTAFVAANSSITSLNFETDPGWSVTNTAITAGAWQRGVPVPPQDSGAPNADFDGSGNCWLTDNRAGSAGFSDVDGGPTVLTSQVFDLSGFDSASVSYARWFSSFNGTLDTMTVEYSTNGGGSWTNLETIGNNPQWVLQTFQLPTLTSQMQFRWVVSDNPNNSVTEAGVDAFRLIAISCTASCYANCDGSTTAPILNVQDFSCFLNAFAAGEPYANCDGSTTAPVLNVQDFSCFLNAFAAGCP